MKNPNGFYGQSFVWLFNVIYPPPPLRTMRITAYSGGQGRSWIFVAGGPVFRESKGQKSPSELQGQSHGGCLGAKPPEAEFKL